MLREVPEYFFKILLGFFQRCWDGGEIPAGWKHAVVVPIHKHGKPRKELGSYWPIALTSHLGKVYESVVKHRLEYYCESQKVFPACQAGFRRGRGDTDHLVKLGEHVGRAIGRGRSSCPAFSIFLELTTRSGTPSCCRNSRKQVFLVRCTTTSRRFFIRAVDAVLVERGHVRCENG